MSLELLAIRFNHDPNSADHDALNLRWNGVTPLQVPEWRQDFTSLFTTPAQSVAAYALEETRGNTLTLQARLAGPQHAGRRVEVRAVPLSAPSLPPGWIESLGALLFLYPLAFHLVFQSLTNTWGALWSTANDILGEVKAKTVQLDAQGESGFETFELAQPRIWERGVGVYPLTWQWQFRLAPGQPWTDFASSSHQIYVVLRTPTAPWQQTPYHPANTQLPWVEVLDVACRWGASALTVDSAATRITHEVNELGRTLLEYGCPVGAVSVYSYPYFNCTAFLDRLRGGEGRGRYLNCSDCATVVSTFANILGCDLWQSRMQTFGKAFPVHPILAIGTRIWQPPCGIGLFSYHEVAWTGSCSSEDRVYDACLEVDNAPPFPPYDGVLPADMPFGRPGEGQYRDLLAAAWGRDLCEPQPLTRQRRFVF